MTAARWTWKSSFSKACVTTQLPNKLALKIDGAKLAWLHSGSIKSLLLPWV